MRPDSVTVNGANFVSGHIFSFQILDVGDIFCGKEATKSLWRYTRRNAANRYLSRGCRTETLQTVRTCRNDFWPWPWPRRRIPFLGLRARTIACDVWGWSRNRCASAGCCPGWWWNSTPGPRRPNRCTAICGTWAGTPRWARSCRCATSSWRHLLTDPWARFWKWPGSDVLYKGTVKSRSKRQNQSLESSRKPASKLAECETNDGFTGKFNILRRTAQVVFRRTGIQAEIRLLHVMQHQRVLVTRWFQ